MNKEDRDLLFADLCSRYPYEPMVNVTTIATGISGDAKLIMNHLEYVRMNDEELVVVRPYLRPMSSMLSEERLKIVDKYGSVAYNPKKGITEVGMTSVNKWIDFLNYLLFRHYDINGLIDKGLAIEAPEDMYEQ